MEAGLADARRTRNYIIGKGLKTIADMLTSEEVPIFEGETVWSKNRIKRILVDERYIGSNGYPSIVEDNFFPALKI